MALPPEFSGSSNPDKKDSDTEDSEKKRKFGRAVAAKAQAANGENTQQPEQPRPRTLSELIDESRARKAQLAAEKVEDKADQPQAEQFADAPQPEIGQDYTVNHQEAAPADSNETSQDDDIGHEQEKPANILYSGEVTIQLNGDAPVAEHVVPLRTEGATTEYRASPLSTTNPEKSEDTRVETDEDLQSIFTPQVQQQHQFRAPAVGPEATAAQTVPSGVGGEALPAVSSELENNSEASGRTVLAPPVEIIRSYQSDSDSESGGPVQANLFKTASSRDAAERLATKQDVDEALHRATKSGSQRGLVSGLFLGTYFANRGLRKRQKNTAKELEQQARELSQVKQELHATQNTQQVNNNRNDYNLTTMNKRFEGTPRPEKAPAAVSEQKLKPEVRFKPQVAEPLEQLQIPDNHHLETSAWHAIEVDNKTGKPVEQASFQYGREYYRERAKEATPKAQRNARTGEAALVAAALAQSPGGAGNGQGSTPADTSLQSGQIINATSQGVPAGNQQDLEADSPKHSGTPAGPIWPWIVALIAVAICLVITLR